MSSRQGGDRACDEEEVVRTQQLYVHTREAVEEGLWQTLAPAALMQQHT